MRYEYKIVMTEKAMNEFGAQGYRLKKAATRSVIGYVHTQEIVYVMERVIP